MAESSASKEDETAFLTAGSEVTFDTVCTPCDNDGEIKEAEAYCMECDEYLCRKCLKYHKRVTNTKHHTLVDKENMSAASPPCDICRERCQVHKDEVIKYYCQEHKTLHCGVCLFRNHDTCEGKVFIPDETKNLTDSAEFKEFQALTETLINKSGNLIKSSHLNIKSLPDNRAVALQEIETYRQEMNAALDKVKAELEEQAEEMTVQQIDAMQSIAEQSSQLQNELKGISAEMNRLLSKKQYCQMFIEMKKNKDKLEVLRKQIEDIGTRCMGTFKFKSNEDLRKMLRKTCGFGELIAKKSKDTKVTHLFDINVKTNENVKTCRVIGVTLLPRNKLIIIDINNKTAKLLDTEVKKIIFEQQFEEAPRDVALIDNSKVAITLPAAKKILIMSSEDKLILDKEIHVDSQCHFIACYDSKQLIVSFENPHEIRILGLSGERLHTISTSSLGGRLFSKAPCVAVSIVTKAIYVSEWLESRVAMLDMDGNFIAEYKDDDLKKAAHCEVVDSGKVYVVGGDSNNIHLLTPYCNKLMILPMEILWPRCLRYCQETERLYVAKAESDTVEVYQLS